MGVYLLDTHHFVLYVVFIFWFGAVGGGGKRILKRPLKQHLQSKMPQSQNIYPVNHINDNLSFTSGHNLFCHLFPWQEKQTILHPLFL